MVNFVRSNQCQSPCKLAFDASSQEKPGSCKSALIQLGCCFAAFSKTFIPASASELSKCSVAKSASIARNLIRAIIESALCPAESLYFCSNLLHWASCSVMPSHLLSSLWPGPNCPSRESSIIYEDKLVCNLRGITETLSWGSQAGLAPSYLSP